jgi:Kef-type K+ transport system membrane component KefB
MDVNGVLLDMLVVLVAAKLAAELADRVGLPAVVGEIVAGVLIGPSVLGLVAPNDVLATLAELGVILLLLEVGMEMDLADLGRVGRAALLVAVIGVALPFALGTGAALGLGIDGAEAVFLGAALTATSVGITARVFGDLRALATVEARTVLGAAVADDVMGLLILTVVTRVVTEGSVSVAGVIALGALAVGFLVVSTAVGMRVAPALFRAVARQSRSTGTLVAFALAFTLALAELAHVVQLAPIIGAFVAGLALARTAPADRIRRELAPVGHLFVPVFFLQIGIDADVREFARPGALGLAAALLAVGVAGKLIASAGMVGAPGDRLLVGIGMIPRGEVGLIFATLGLREGVFGDDVYAALLVVVLATTLTAPSLLRWRLRRLQPEAHSDATSLLAAVDGARRGDANALALVSSLPPGVRRLDAPTQASLVDLVARGGATSWRLLSVSGVIERALPELGEVLHARVHDVVVDPLEPFRWARVAALRGDGERDRAVLFAALALDATNGAGGELANGTPGHGNAVARGVARATADRLGMPAAIAQQAAALVDDAELLGAAARRADGLDEEPVRALAAHLGDPVQLHRLHRLVRAGELEPATADRVDALVKLCADVLEPPRAARPEWLDVDRRRRLAIARLPLPRDPRATDLIERAPRAYILRHDAETVARHAIRRAVHVGRREVRVFVDECSGTERAGGEWRVEFVARDHPGLLARETRTLAEFRADVAEASVVTWPGRRALSSFLVRSAARPDAAAIAARCRELLALPLASPPADEVEITFDDHGSPWHTRAIARGPDRAGALAAVSTALAVGGASVHSATIATSGDELADVFELTDRRGAKLDDRTKRRIERVLRDGSIRRRRF